MFVAELLTHLEQVGFTGAPRYLGVDDADRDSFTFLPGTVTPRFQQWSDDQVAAAGALLRSLHDATRGSALAGAMPVVLHGDPGSNNTVLDRHGMPTAFIDFDTAGPGQPVEDLAYLAWSWVLSGKPGARPVAVQAVQLRVLVDAYRAENCDRGCLLEAVTARQVLNAEWWREQARHPGPRGASREQMLERAAWSQREADFTQRHRRCFSSALVG
ncbi:aminoglycoside phosphotransferase family protein [Streptacidiphilus sp. MAP5-52]|uniref:aminoglycoside phosphotransferase family protein n=1 Tax=Streptacidiphilus sp. MAP5-52 TaxID=3156267 RepID=UPI00351503B7